MPVRYDKRPCVHCGNAQREHTGNQSVYCVEGTVFYEPEQERTMADKKLTGDDFSRIGYEAVERLVRLEGAVQRGEVPLIADDSSRGIYAAHMLSQAISTINMLRACVKP